MKPCIYIEITCPIHEEVRMALAEIPSTEIAICPVCSRMKLWSFLGAGMTSRTLPFFEVLKEHRNWNREHRDPRYQHQERMAAL